MNAQREAAVESDEVAASTGGVGEGEETASRKLLSYWEVWELRLRSLCVVFLWFGPPGEQRFRGRKSSAQSALLLSRQVLFLLLRVKMQWKHVFLSFTTLWKCIMQCTTGSGYVLGLSFSFSSSLLLFSYQRKKVPYSYSRWMIKYLYMIV